MSAMTDDTENTEADLELDARDLRCPMPLLKLRQTLRDLPDGYLVLLRATDAGALRDIPAYLGQTSHVLVQSSQQQDELYFWIRVQW